MDYGDNLPRLSIFAAGLYTKPEPGHHLVGALGTLEEGGAFSKAIF